jgi:hypothetical protein
VIDPLKIFVVPGGPKRWACVCRVEKESVYNIETEYQIKVRKYAHLNADQKRSTYGELVDFWEIALENTPLIDPETGEPRFNPVTREVETNPGIVVRNAVVFENEFILPLRVMDGYDDIPYTIGFFKPIDRDNSAAWGHGIIRPLETIIPLLERMINRRTRQIDVFSSLPLVSKTLHGRTVQLDPGLGNLAHLSVEEDLGFPIWPGNPPDVEEQINFFRSKIQQSGFSDVMYGAGPSQVSGYALSQLGDQNRIRLEQPVNHLQLMWSIWGRKVLRLTANFAANSVVRVYGRARGKDFVEQIIGGEVADYMVKAEIKPEFPNEKTRKHAMQTQVRGYFPRELSWNVTWILNSRMMSGNAR